MSVTWRKKLKLAGCSILRWTMTYSLALCKTWQNWFISCIVGKPLLEANSSSVTAWKCRRCHTPWLHGYRLKCESVNVFITSAKEVMFLPVFVCLFVCLFVFLSGCLLARWLKKLWTDLSEILRVCRRWHKLPVIQFWRWSARNPGF